jgi:hypothetical protein
MNFGADSSFAGNKTAQGNADGNGVGDFYYEPPTDFLALCTSNLSAPEIALPGEHFNTVLYTGNGSTQAITGAGFQPDLTWIKIRSAAANHGLFDSVRGVRTSLNSNTTTESRTAAGATEDLYAWSSDGFSVGVDTGGTSYVNCNETSATYASWNWLAGGGAGSSNTDGATATTSTSVNTTGGFSISTLPSYSGNTTFGHGLSAAPTLVIMKAMSGIDQWTVGHSGLGSWGKGIALNSTAAEDSNATFFNSLAPDASIVNLGAWDATYTRVVYCFHEVEGYSKFGSYTGNGDANGTFVYCGFRPAWYMIRRVDSAPPTGWEIEDNKRLGYNVANRDLIANGNYNEQPDDRTDMLSNGFKIRATSNNFNNNGGTYIYIAFAESPFKTSNAR